jgi:hypothetical protein
MSDLTDLGEAERADVLLLREAAERVRDAGWLGAELTAALADWLDLEAIMLGEIEHLVDVVNAAIHASGGGEAELRIGRTEDGRIKMEADSTRAALRLAAVITGRAR